MITIRKVELTDLQSFNKALKVVCDERVFLASIEGIPIEKHKPFLENIVQNNLAQIVAVDEDEIVGWCDILPNPVPAFSHVGHLGMGIVKAYRGRGLGKQLLEQCIALVKETSLEKVELEVFADNMAGCKLYTKFGFIVEGVKKKARKLDGNYQDIQLMSLWIS